MFHPQSMAAKLDLNGQKIYPQIPNKLFFLGFLNSYDVQRKFEKLAWFSPKNLVQKAGNNSVVKLCII